MVTEIYSTCPIKRERRTKNEINGLKVKLCELLHDNHPMTVRQVFYQMTSAGYIPKTETAYKQLICRLLAELRLEKILPFNWIADSTRWMRKPDTYNSIEELLGNNIQTYRRELWSHQTAYVEIWIEKDALAGVVSEITEKWDVPLMVTRGFPSLSFLYAAAQTIAWKRKEAYIYYFGDYDPAGVGISENVDKRLHEFSADIAEKEIHFERVAVTPWQIKNLSLPTRPTKQSDTRSKNFSAESVELDAIPADLLRKMVDHYITLHVNPDVYKETLKIEALERESLKKVLSNMTLRN